MHLQVVIGIPPGLLPPDIHTTVHRRLREVAAALEGIPASAVTVWDSFALGGLQLDVNGWRVVYRVDHGNGVLIAESAAFAGP